MFVHIYVNVRKTLLKLIYEPWLVLGFYSP